MKIIDYEDIAKINSKIQPFVNLSIKQDYIEGIPDSILALATPIIAYWTYSIYFHIIDVYKLLEQYRIHPSEEQLSKNKVTLHIVIRDVIFQHLIQTITGLIFYKFEPIIYTGYENSLLWEYRQLLPSSIPTTLIYFIYWYGLSIIKIFSAFLIIDTWQFFLHKLMHMNKFLYRHFHSRHHQLYVPYAFGALFNNPVEGFLLDTVGAGVASLSLGLSPKESIFLYTFSTLKTVDDHCGYSLPWDLFQRIFPNNSIYHDIHHQMFGIKYNFSQPFFIFWDNLFGTTYHGIDAYKEKQKEITIQKYKQFLKERKEKKVDKFE
jgi:sphinganine C4-monooxygenase